MKFVYEYRTSDNVKHVGVVNAANRDAAFAILKSGGIKPSRLGEAPGLFNKLLGKGKRWLAIVILAILSVSMAIAIVRRSSNASVGVALDSQVRRQVIGDAVVIEKGIRSAWSAVFRFEGERFLAAFAIPGVPVARRNPSEQEIRAALSRKVLANESDGIEARQVKSMVEGMKNELREYLESGGTVFGYCQRLVERQEEEMRYFVHVRNELTAAERGGAKGRELEALWERRNEDLHRMGIRLVPMPD